MRTPLRFLLIVAMLTQLAAPAAALGSKGKPAAPIEQDTSGWEQVVVNGTAYYKKSDGSDNRLYSLSTQDGASFSAANSGLTYKSETKVIPVKRGRAPSRTFTTVTGADNKVVTDNAEVSGLGLGKVMTEAADKTPEKLNAAINNPKAINQYRSGVSKDLKVTVAAPAVPPAQALDSLKSAADGKVNEVVQGSKPGPKPPSDQGVAGTESRKDPKEAANEAMKKPGAQIPANFKSATPVPPSPGKDSGVSEKGKDGGKTFLQKTGMPAAVGAGGGALVGLMLGGPVGALVGAVVGAVGGVVYALFKNRDK